MDHPHLHCIVTGGGLSDDLKEWIHCRKDFLFPVKVMSRLFRGKFFSYLMQSYEKEKLKFPGKIDHLKYRSKFRSLISSLYTREWIVYSKPPLKNPETVFRYLSHYTHRIAISNHRIIKAENGKVHFLWRDYAHGNEKKVMILDASEFIRRFLLHILPDKFVKIRYYGLFGNRNRKVFLDRCRRLLGTEDKKNCKKQETWQEILIRLTGFDVNVCPFCSNGKMHLTHSLQPVRCNSPPGAML